MRVMARFRSFDMTGMTKFNSYNQRSPSQLTQDYVDENAALNYNSNGVDGGAIVDHRNHGGGSH